LACVGAAGSSALADVIYRETFGHAVTGTTDPGPAVFDWAVHSGPNGIWRNVAAGSTNQANVNASGGRTVTVYNSGSGVNQAGCNSREDTYLNVNAGGPNSYLYDTTDDGISLNNANIRGNAYVAATNTSWSASGTSSPTSQERRCLYWTPEFSLNPADYAAGSIKFSWFQGNQNVLDPIHLAVRIGTQWFVQTSGTTNSTSVTLATFFSASELKTVNFSTAAAGWSTLNFDGTYDTVADTGTNSTDPGSGGMGLSIGAAAASDLPAGAITAFGLLSNDPQTTGAGNRRFDSFTIEATLLGGGASASWATNGNGNWSVGTNWTSNPATPHGVDNAATFGSAITAPHTATVDVNRTVGAITFDSAFAYTLAGPGVITVDVSTVWGSISAVSGSLVISAHVTLNMYTFFTCAAGSGVAVTGNLTAAGRAVIKAGAGTAQFQNVRAATLNVTAGTASISAKGTANSTGGTSVVQTLSIAASGATLDMTNNSLVIDYTGGVGNLVDDTMQHLQTARLTSSSATLATRLGYGDNAVLNKADFGGLTVDTDSLLIKFTYAGDSDLDGDVDVSDLGALATNWQTNSVWTGGDFDYNGTVDVNDLGLLASNWQAGVGNPLGPDLQTALSSLGLPSASVPEPAGVGLVLATVALKCQRRRR
jgi:hypothetical protein